MESILREVQIQVLPEEKDNEAIVQGRALKKAGLSKADYPFFAIRKRSIDARKKTVVYNLIVQLSQAEIPEINIFFPKQDVSKSPAVHIVGAGPAGLYAALKAITVGLKPIIYERGKDVRARRRDLAQLNKESVVNPESNYCFGEGGAGTYSDGKLYTRSKKRGAVQTAMEWLVYFGAPKDILVDAHPHIGTNKLPQLIVAIRETILNCGGEVHFEHKLTDIKIENKAVKALVFNEDIVVPCENVVLATGHSARDIFSLLHKNKVLLKAKGFAIGVRIEHQQALIDEIQYHGRKSDEFLPPASYSLVTQVDGKGVYSFCMCPGGIVAPCATENNEVVTNGWSPSKRNNPYSNSGIVVSFEPEELPGYSPSDPFVGLRFQQSVEQKCWEAAGKTQAVPAQRMIDFIEGKVSKDLPKSSYQPGLVSVDLNKVLPETITIPLKQAFLDFGKKMKGYLTNEAILHAPESRTSSPVSIPRDKDTLQHIEIKGLYPCGEGAGYAGGIISAAVDGMNCVEAIAGDG
jgi:uncharacterized FAD-dependent dehydrogenase